MDSTTSLSNPQVRSQEKGWKQSCSPWELKEGTCIKYSNVLGTTLIDNRAGMEDTEHYHGEGLHEACLVVVECNPLLLLPVSCKVKCNWNCVNRMRKSAFMLVCMQGDK